MYLHHKGVAVHLGGAPADLFTGRPSCCCTPIMDAAPVHMRSVAEDLTRPGHRLVGNCLCWEEGVRDARCL